MACTLHELRPSACVVGPSPMRMAAARPTGPTAMGYSVCVCVCVFEEKSERA